MTLEKYLPLRQSFDDVFSSEDKYFGEWHIKCTDDFTEFIESIDNRSTLFRQLRFLKLYLESLEKLKVRSSDENWSLSNLMSKETWYCCVLLLLMGLIDQNTKHEKNRKGKLPTLKRRFCLVMDKLDTKERDDMIEHYNNGAYKEFKDVISHLYGTRNFFAHEIVLPEESVPQDRMLSFNKKYKDRIVLSLNISHGQIFLYIVKALIRYLGFNGSITITSNKKFDSLVDFLRET